MKLSSTTWQAWSCTVRVTVSDPDALAPAAMDLVALMADVDAATSRFRGDSELSRANRLAGRPVPVSRLLVDFVDVALTAARESDGAVDPTIGRALRAQGYDRDIALVPGPARPLQALRTAGWTGVRINRDINLLTVPVGTALDLGATAKAHTADLAARRIRERYDTSVLVEIGGDLAVAGPMEGGWPIAVAERAGGVGQQVTLADGGMTTSTTTVRRWNLDGRERHHIIDPRTGQPSDGPWRTATVAAPSAVAANTASTGAIVLGERAEEWLAMLGHPARLVHRDGTVRVLGSWPDPQPVAPDGTRVPAVAGRSAA